MLMLIMGATASGKTTLGKALAVRLGYAFIDSNQYYPKSAIAKMRAGYLPDGDDMHEFINNITARILFYLSRKIPVIIADSCIKKVFRDQIRDKTGMHDMVTIYLHVDKDILVERFLGRNDDFFEMGLLERQLYFLEPPAMQNNGHIVDADSQIQDTIENILEILERHEERLKLDQEIASHKAV